MQDTHGSEEARPSAGAWWLLATGLVLISAAATWQRDSVEMPRDVLRLPAQVVSIESRVRPHPAGEQVVHAPKVRFTRPDGREVVFVSSVWTPTVRHLERQPVDVLFDRHTGLAIVDARRGAYSAYALLGGLGALLMALGVYRLAAHAGRRMQDPGGVTPA